MGYINLYGRNPDVQATTFDYPSTRLPLRVAPPLFLTKPAAASPVFGNPTVRVLDSDDTRVQLDPSSTYEYTQRWKGMGGLGVEPKPSVTRDVIEQWQIAAKSSPGLLAFGMGIFAVVALMGLKVIGKVGGS